jgi:hypothetical protein
MATYVLVHLAAATGPANAIAYTAPSLLVDALAVPSTVSPEVPFDVMYRLGNAGTGASVETFSCLWGVQAGVEILLGVFAEDAVAPGQAREVTVSVTWPLHVSGEVTISARADCYRVPFEPAAGRHQEARTRVAAPLALETVRLPDGHTSIDYAGTVRVVGGMPPVTMEVRGLPLGLQAAPDGRVTGTTTVAGRHLLEVVARDTTSATTSAQIALVVRTGAFTEATSPSMASLRVGTVGQPYCTSAPILPTGVVGVEWSLQSDPIPGVFITEDGGLCGVPSHAVGTILRAVAISPAGQMTRHAIALSAASQPAIEVVRYVIPCCDEPSCAAVGASETTLVSVLAVLVFGWAWFRRRGSAAG